MERMESNSYEMAKWGMTYPPRRGRCSNYSYMRSVAPVVFDNYYIRVLLGEAVLMLPAGSITEHHRRKAYEVLNAMDMVLLNNANETPATLLQVTGIANLTACRPPRRAKCMFSDEGRIQAARDNALDFELFRQVAGIHERHVRATLGTGAWVDAKQARRKRF